MSRLSTLDENDLQPETLSALEAVRMNGKLADVYLQFANSEAALRAYLQMEQALAAGSLDGREIEAIKLWVSQQTGCDYCLSIHTFKAGKAGFTGEQILALRRGESIGDARIDCLLRLATQLMQVPGKLSDGLLQEARDMGIDDENLVDLTMVISTIHFTNLTNHINDSKSPLPPAPSLEN
ncbi:carboxymuconolactone decarboxylase family protein [Granulosicoccus sp. 3-233]|uniref:carboxymuconolactone decarboxylase family protein n=1 Tax=Granulosicoccus sp. 3-233 TaxID=3417969 RepID=UPI003D328DB1